MGAMTGGTASTGPYELGGVTADLVVLTVLEEEYEAVLACLATPHLLLGGEGTPNTYAWQLGGIDAPRYGAAFRVVVGMGTPTPTYGALAAMQAIRLFDPRYIAFVGVAGGFEREGQRHGDVVVSSTVVAYEYGKVDTGGFTPRGDFTYRCDGGLVRAAKAVASARWWREDENTREPRVRTGMIASGDKVIDDPEEALFTAVAKIWPKLLAVEMEGAGVGASAHEAQSQGCLARFVLVRGISDMPHTKAAGEGASTGERDRWKQTAARNAARFLAHLVAEAWPEPPRGERRAPSEGEPELVRESGPAVVVAGGAVAGGAVAGGAGPSVGGATVNAMTGQTEPARRDPARASEKIPALGQQLEEAYGRKNQLLDVGAATGAVDRDILELKRQLREGGRLRAGDSLGEGRYVLVAELGRGGFAIVWKAKDKVEKRHVAIKVLHANLAGDTIRRERFYRGARAMQRLPHPGVVRVLEPEGEDGGFCYFVMELVANGNLHDAVVGKRVSGNAVLEHILRVGEALAAAHTQGMIHRDVKPQNILLDEGFEAKLTDFDLVGTKDTTGGTRTGAMGTVIYAAPECLDKPQEATERADVFGLGMTAIFGLSGKALTLSTLRNAEPTIAGLDCWPAVKEVLRRAVDWAPDARYADAGAMVSALRAAMRAEIRTDPGTKVGDGDTGSGSGAQPGEPAGALGGASRAYDAQNAPWATVGGSDTYGLWATFEVNGVRQRMRWIPPGTFVMGSPQGELGRYDDEGPQHQVTLSRGYWLGETPVAQALWVAVMGKNPSRFRRDRPDGGERPVERMSWDDCQVFLERLNERVGGLFARLPTEAEWERACRGGMTGTTWGGELSGEDRAPELDAIAWYGGNSGGQTHPVGRKAANPYGLHDMLGNVWEWCADVTSLGLTKYSAQSEADPVATGQGSFRVNRGGSWGSSARDVRAANRGANLRGRAHDYLGFRLAGGQVFALQ